jgi:hypothetical protein
MAVAREVLGSFRAPFVPVELSVRATEDLMARQEQTREEAKALARYFQGQWSPQRPLRLPETQARAPRDPGKAARHLKQMRGKMLDLLPGYKDARKAYGEAWRARWEAAEAIALMQWDFRPGPDTYSAPMPDHASADRVKENAVRRQIELVETLDSFRGLYYRIGGRLATLAEQVESALGLPRLPQPPENAEG